MKTGDAESYFKRIIIAAISAAAGWAFYGIRQSWTPIAVIGVFFDLGYIITVYMLIPFAFSSLLLDIAEYALNRFNGYAQREIGVVLCYVFTLVLGFYVVGPVTGEGAVLAICLGLVVVRGSWRLR